MKTNYIIIDVQYNRNNGYVLLEKKRGRKHYAMKFSVEDLKTNSPKAQFLKTGMKGGFKTWGEALKSSVGNTVTAVNL